MTLAAVVQLSCTSDEEANLAMAEALIRRAASHGAQLIATPENTNFLGPHQEKVRRAEPLDGPTGQRLAKLARELGVHLLIGSLNEKSDDPERCYNTSALFGPGGELLGRYRKIHLFDVDVSADVRFLESNTVVPGEEVVVVNTAVGAIGLSICYDLRFPRLYQALVDKGAEILTIPSAFTLTTGKDHWEPLIRARAIENQAWVLAPGQHGEHDDKGLRHSWGHSMIVDPWGHIVGMASDGPGLALAEIDLEKVAVTRRGMPVRQHRRVT
ncbi:MAG: carbon-nitrogen hydrolase family protein [Deltaproteobacteria bacterium]|nr:MAG: carbon-nitrogen hydrolase family protein [Deltaproteobacteria bacterium]